MCGAICKNAILLYAAANFIFMFFHRIGYKCRDKSEEPSIAWQFFCGKKTERRPAAGGAALENNCTVLCHFFRTACQSQRKNLLALLFIIFYRSGNELTEERVRRLGTGLKFGVELHAYIEVVCRNFHSLHE